MRYVYISLALLAFLPIGGGCASPLVRNLESFRAAKKAGDYETASKYITDDARIWWTKKEGPGSPLTAKGGPYRHWDKEFNSTSTKSDFRVEGNTVTYVSREMNDFYRLTDHTPGPALITYYFNDDGKITGMFYRALDPASRRPPDRRKEFEAWASEKYPGLLDSEEMKIPNNPKRWRELLVQWRADVGLPPVH